MVPTAQEHVDLELDCMFGETDPQYLRWCHVENLSFNRRRYPLLCEMGCCDGLCTGRGNCEVYGDR